MARRRPTGPHAHETRDDDMPPADGPVGGPAGPGAIQEWHFVDYLRLLSKRRWTAIPVFLLVGGLTAWITFTTTPTYEATAQLLIEAERQNIVIFKDVAEQDRASADYYQTQYKILQSRALAKATLDALGLWDDPRFGGGKTEGAEQERSGIRRVLDTAMDVPKSLLDRFIASRTRTEKPAVAAQAKTDSEQPAQSRTIDIFLSNLTIAPVRNSRLVDVKFQSSDPALAASVANALAQAYIDRNLQFKFMASKEASDWLANQLAEQRKRVETSEQALNRYREAHPVVSSDDPQVMQKIGELNTAVTRAKMERIEKATLYNQIAAVQHDPAALESVPAIQSNAFLQELKSQIADLQRQEAQLAQRLGDLHPELVKVRAALRAAEEKRQREIQNTVLSVRNSFLGAEMQEQKLTAALNEQEARRLSQHGATTGYHALEREVASNRNIFESLLQRAHETGITGELKPNNIRIADEAHHPRSPVYPRTRRNLSLGFAAGFCLAVLLAFLIEYLDNKIKSPDEIRKHLGLPCLGLVPKIPAADLKGHGAPLLNNGVPPMFGEAFRAVRTNVFFAAGDQTETLLVTSSGPGEGKSLVASNLAVGFALAGQRVLLVDADMRRPRVHEIFSTPQEPGLSELMTGQAKVTQAVTQSSIPGLWLLPAGAIPPNPAELLSSQRFRQFAGALKNHFDWVIIDSPPVMAVTDASLLAHIASGVVFVVASEMTGRPVALTALEQLDAARARFLGAVLNGVDIKRNAFYYAPYFRREYGQCYTSATRS